MSNNFKFALFALFALLALPAALLAQSVLISPGGSIYLIGGHPLMILPAPVTVFPAVNNVTTNWQNAGLVGIGGIPTRTTQCGATISPSGITPPGTGDDLQTIQAAINACATGDVVQLAAGSFKFARSELPIKMFTSITLRGYGTCNSAGGGEPPVAYCPTQLIVYDGMLQTYVQGGACGTSTPGTNPCGSTDKQTIQMGANNGNNLSWGGGGSCYPGNNTSVLGCGASLAVSVAQGATTIQVSSTSNFSIGMFVRIDEQSGATSQTNPANTTGGGSAYNLFGAADFAGPNTQAATGRSVYCPGCTTPSNFASAYGVSYDRQIAEIKKVSAIGAGPCPGTACTLTFDSPLTIAFRAGSPYYAQVYWPTDGSGNPLAFAQEVGIENLSIEKSTHVPIQMDYCAYCWIRGVETFLWSTGISIRQSVRVEVSGNYLHDGADLEPSGSEYPLAIDSTTESLFTNNIIHYGGKGMVGRACGGGNVVSYNYIDDQFYMASAQTTGNYWIDTGLNGSHWVGCHHMLFEGNQAATLGDDETWGNEVYHTYFRNWGMGPRTPFSDPSITVSTSSTYNIANSTVNDVLGDGYNYITGYPKAPSPVRAVGEMMWDYEMAYVGNVLGVSGQTTIANGFVYSGCVNLSGCASNGHATKAIWLLGWTGGECLQSGGVYYCTDPNLNGTNTPQLFFRSGNYDYLNNAIVDWAAGYSQALPNSLYLSSAPSFFTGASYTYPWPWVTSQSSPYLQLNSHGGAGLPAKARWDAGTPFVQP